MSSVLSGASTSKSNMFPAVCIWGEVFAFFHFFFLVWELNGNVLWSFLMSTCGRFSSMEHWQIHTHTYTHPIALLPQSLQEWQVIQKFIFMAGNGNGTTKRGVLPRYHQLLRCTGGERVTFNSVKMRGLRPACSRCTGTYRNGTDGL